MVSTVFTVSVAVVGLGGLAMLIAGATTYAYFKDRDALSGRNGGKSELTLFGALLFSIILVLIGIYVVNSELNHMDAARKCADANGTMIERKCVEVRTIDV